MRSILVVIVVAVVVWWVRRRIELWQARRLERARAARRQHLSERMLVCSQCGVHAPQSEGVMHHGQFYCSPRHRDAALRN